MSSPDATESRFSAGTEVEVYDVVAGTWKPAEVEATRTGNIKVKYKGNRKAWITGNDIRRIRLKGEGGATEEEKDLSEHLNHVTTTPDLHVVGDEVIIKRNGRQALKFVFSNGMWYEVHRDQTKSAVGQHKKPLHLKIDCDKKATKSRRERSISIDSPPKTPRRKRENGSREEKSNRPSPIRTRERTKTHTPRKTLSRSHTPRAALSKFQSKQTKPSRVKIPSTTRASNGRSQTPGPRTSKSQAKRQVRHTRTRSETTIPKLALSQAFDGYSSDSDSDSPPPAPKNRGSDRRPNSKRAPIGRSRTLSTSSILSDSSESNSSGSRTRSVSRGARKHSRTPSRSKLFSVGSSSPARRKLTGMDFAGFYRKQGKIQPTNERSLTSLVQFMKRTIGKDPLELCFAIYYWICTHVACDPDFVPDKNTNVAIIALQTGRCPPAGFARLFEILVTKLGVDNYVISGVTKERYKSSANRRPHTWNAINIDGKWELVDCCWGAGVITQDESEMSVFKPEYDEFYFCAPPYCLIYTHFPNDSEHQFLDQPIGIHQYNELMKIHPRFWKLGVNVCSHFSKRFQTTGHERVVFLGNRNVEMNARICKPDSNTSTATEYKTMPVELTPRGFFVADVRFPYTGTWALDIFVRDRKSRQFSRFVRYEVQNVKILN